MLYLKHDFYSNFNSGIESGDNDFITDMIVNELSEVIVYQRKDMLDLLEKVQLKLNEKVSDEKIINIIIDNISTNQKLVKGLAYLIAQNNQSSKQSKVVKGKDGKERVVKIDAKPASINQIDMVASGIIGLGDSFKYKPQLKKEFKIRLLRLIETKSNAVGDREIKIKDNKNGKYWLLGILVIGAGIGVYFYLKNKKKIAAEGMEIKPIETPTPTPIVEPVQVAPEVPAVPQPTIPVAATEIPISTPPPVMGNNI